MQQGPGAAIQYELWGYILSELSIRDMANFRATCKAAHHQTIIDIFWNIKKFPSIAQKQYEEIEFFRKQREGLISEYASKASKGVKEEVFHNRNVPFANLLSSLPEDGPATTEAEYGRREKLLNDINILIIESYIDLSLNCLGIPKNRITRVPKKLLDTPALQEYWQNLDSINLCQNQVRDLDLSRCTALKYLDCSHNQLEKLNVSRCERLKFLFCYNNFLSFLDIFNLRLLASFNCSNNLLEELDASQCRNLLFLSCVHNHLRTLKLDAPNFSSLKCIDNEIISFDFGNCPDSLTIDDEKILEAFKASQCIKKSQHTSAMLSFQYENTPLKVERTPSKAELKIGKACKNLRLGG
ncbi:leucine-rich repeat domain-containing protein [Candidatus Berkiella aquae]|uniref:Internalin-J n=1 Tax=Candidatus Berkiella aquae TaxID=295108 RepID=A0A0Q9YPI7_9GAMM|nr:leucine-rich repeat domain-containing protein [Candidatus Berkiella aquae]MCS5710476.1 leucine-rich repeat domain-containing protein [Candidatus Berkiella aquae]